MENIMHKLVIDSREHQLIKLLDTRPYETKNLDIGDIMFEKDNCGILVIERKTVADLISSIIDGRYKEQKMRIKSSNVKGLYVIEGSGNEEEENKVESAIISISLDGIGAIRVKNIEGTVRIIDKLMKKLDKIEKIEQKGGEGYEDTIKSKKKKNMTPQMCMIAQLTQVVGISAKTAKEIINQKGSIAKLVSIYEKEGEFALSELVVGKTKLGNKKSSSIYSSLFGIATATKANPSKKKVDSFLADNGFKTTKALFSE